MELSTGSDGCKCTNETTVLASLTERYCKAANGQDGILLRAEGGYCVPHTYGSGNCLRHDLTHDPKCSDDNFLNSTTTEDYCLRAWCYVDAETCMQSSSERVFRSDYFSHDVGDLFFSFSTCGSNADDWLDYKDRTALGGNLISAAVPTYTEPLMYKRDPFSNEILASSQAGGEYFNNTVSFEGVYINYLNTLMDIADGDLNVTYKYASKVGRLVHPTSKYTAAIQDIEDGLRDMAIGSFWITGQRLKMTSFTVPFCTVLVIPKPGADTSVGAHISKVLEPFELEVWGLILGLITLTALLSVWFTRYGRGFTQVKRKERMKKGAYARVALDECLQKGMFFCSAGVHQDSEDALPQKLLLFFALLLVSAYVANLAAFLTRPVEFTGAIQAVTRKGLRVCAHSALKTEEDEAEEDFAHDDDYASSRNDKKDCLAQDPRSNADSRSALTLSDEANRESEDGDTSRVLQEILHCVQQIKRQKESVTLVAKNE